ncbi:MAG: FAD-binding protein [Planctomycetes bacterium]|nr:FAD-binding protein [Planctomycetota bacterium]MCB9868893.1 FAD-binding protein [Planctomycetota bacterium]
MEALFGELTRRFGPKRCLTQPESLLAYECDGFTIHRQRPLAVVLPEDTEEVVAAVRLLHAHRVAFLPRGAGTGLSGGATPTEPLVILDTARMKRVLRVDPEERIATVQPGVVNLDLTRHVRAHGLHYAPDPSSQSVCTIGGNLAENSGGPHCFKYGMTTDHVLGAKVVLPDGTLVELGGPAGARPCGGLDLTGLFCGSEGTFGIATEITVRLSPDPESTVTLLASFRSMRDACGACSDIVAAGLVPAALEILDKATIGAIEASVYRAGYPADAAAVLLVELDGPAAATEADAEEVLMLCRSRDAIAIETAHSPEDRLRLWKGRKGAFGAMGRLSTDLYVLDGVVPRTRLIDTLETITAIGAKYRVTLTNVFHAGDGNLHPNIAYDGRDAEETQRVVAAGMEILRTCVAAGGSITGEHGIGSEKLDHVALMFTAEDLEVMERVRSVFNPDGRCNPGKVLPTRNSCAEVGRWPEMVARVLDPGGPSP